MADELTVELLPPQDEGASSQHEHTGTDARKVKLGNISGFIEVVETMPSSQPKDIYGQIKLYVSGTDGSICIYDTKNKSWKQFAASTIDITGKADTSLNNLSAVSINTSLVSDTDSTDDLGSQSKYWANGYIDSLRITNDITTVDGTPVFKEVSSTPVAIPDSGRIYAESNNNLYFQDGDGTNHRVAKYSEISSSSDKILIGGTGTATTDGQTVWTWPFFNSSYATSVYSSYRISFACVASSLNVFWGTNTTTGTSEFAIQRNSDAELLYINIPSGTAGQILSNNSATQSFNAGDTMRIRVKNGGGGATGDGWWSAILTAI